MWSRSIAPILMTAFLAGCINSDPTAFEDMSNHSTDQERMLLEYADVAFDRLARLGYDKLDAVDKNFVCVWALEGEVNNGGFDQYYFNTSGDWAIDTPDALIEIGAAKTAEIVKRGNDLFGISGPSRDSTIRQTQLNDFSESVHTQLGSLDADFYRYTDDLSTLLASYLTRNRPRNSR